MKKYIYYLICLTTILAAAYPATAQGCNIIWDFEDSLLNEWDATATMAIRSPGQNSAYAMYAENIPLGQFQQAILGSSELTELGYIGGDILTWTGVLSATNVLTTASYIRINYTDATSLTITLPQNSPWTSFTLTSTTTTISQLIITISGESATVAFDNLAINFCPPGGSPTLTPTPTYTPTPWPTLYPTSTPAPTLTPDLINIPDTLDDPDDIIPALPTPFSIPAVTHTLSITPFWNLDNLAVIISTARTIPRLLNEYNLLTIMLITGLIALVVYYVTKIVMSRSQ